MQSVLREVYIWSKLRHENVLPLLGIATKFDYTVSIVSAWMAPGNARNYVQRQEVDPRPLVSRNLRSDGLYRENTYRSSISQEDLNTSMATDLVCIMGISKVYVIPFSYLSNLTMSHHSSTFSSPAMVAPYSPISVSPIWSSHHSALLPKHPWVVRSIGCLRRT